MEAVLPRRRQPARQRSLSVCQASTREGCSPRACRCGMAQNVGTRLKPSTNANAVSVVNAAKIERVGDALPESRQRARPATRDGEMTENMIERLRALSVSRATGTAL